MQPPSYVLLYNSWTGYDGFFTVDLKLLSLEHPFTRLLLRQGSRSCTEVRNYSTTLWRRYQAEPCSWREPDLTGHQRSDACGYRRERVDWSSSYGPPHEDHLTLYQCIAAWVKAHKSMTLGTFHIPCKIVGSIRLDDGEHIGSELDINSVRRNRHLFPSQECCMSECGSTRKSNEVILDLPYNNKAKWRLANEHRRSWHPQTYFFLKDAVLSCTQVELQEVLRDYMQTQAHEQAMKLKAELLESCFGKP